LKNIHVVTVTRRLHFEDPESLGRMNAMALAGMSFELSTNLAVGTA
jgi:hypothetical protein